MIIGLCYKTGKDFEKFWIMQVQTAELLNFPFFLKLFLWTSYWILY